MFNCGTEVQSAFRLRSITDTRLQISTVQQLHNSTIEKRLMKDKKENKKREKVKYSVREVMRKKYIGLPMPQQWVDAIGEPDSCGSWIIWGNSGNGKTSFAMQLAKCLTLFGKVAYNSLEEGVRFSLSTAMARYNVQEVQGKLMILDKLPMDELIEFLKKRRSPKFIIIDSLQYSGLDKESYKRLIKQFKDKLFIFISHAKGSLPADAVGTAIMYDADVKIYVKNFVAHCKSRMKSGGVGEFRI